MNTTYLAYGVLIVIAIASFCGAYMIKKSTSKPRFFNELEVRFHKEANYFGEHGTMNVSHLKQGLIETPVRFVFVGLSTPPKLDLGTFLYLWEAAKAQGYIPHSIMAYGKENEVINNLPVVDESTLVERPNVVTKGAGPMSSVWTKEDPRKQVKAG